MCLKEARLGSRRRAQWSLKCRSEEFVREWPSLIHMMQDVRLIKSALNINVRDETLKDIEQEPYSLS